MNAMPTTQLRNRRKQNDLKHNYNTMKQRSVTPVRSITTHPLPIGVRAIRARTFHLPADIGNLNAIKSRNKAKL